MSSPYFSFLRFATGGNTEVEDPSWADLWTIPIVLTSPRMILADFRATVQCQYTEPSSSFLGVALRYVLDGEPQGLDPSYFEIDPAFPSPNIDTIAERIDLRSLLAIPSGSHVLLVQWQTLGISTRLIDPQPSAQRATIFPNGANLTLEGK